MLRFGYEEPLSANPLLFSYDTDEQKAVPTKHSDERLNRYSFVYQGRIAEAELAFIELLQTICQHYRWDITLMRRREFSMKEFERIPSLVWLSQERKMGHDTAHDDRLAVSKEMIQPDAFKKSADVISYHNRLTTPIMLLGNEVLTAEEFLGKPWRELLDHSYSSLSPNSNTMNWLVQHGMSLAYTEDEEPNLRGMILITPEKIPHSLVANYIDQGSIFLGTDRSLWRP